MQLLLKSVLKKRLKSLNNPRAAFIFLALMCLPSCVHKKSVEIVHQLATNTVNEENHDAHADMANDIMHYQESLLTDVPLPLFDERIVSAFRCESTEKNLCVALGYESPLTVAQAIDFFMHQMELYGWKCVICFSGTHNLLNFKAPRKYCTMLIEHGINNGSRIFLYISRQRQKFYDEN